MTRRADAGFTLIEVLVSLALFAMIAGAGVSVLDQVLRAQSQTDGRLEHLASLQRLMHLVTRDLSEATPGTVQGDGSALTLGRSAGPGRVSVTYALTEGRMTRAVAQIRGSPTPATQRLLAEVAALRWQYLDGAGIWQDTWPGTADLKQADLRAVVMVINLAPGTGDLRRVVAVPRVARP
jgi:general secretion pathway protein J